MMARKIGRRLLSLLLVFSLVIPMGIPAYAMEIPYVYLEGSRVSAEGNAVNFGITEQALGEKDTIYGIPIYREGDTTQAATVKIKTYDVSATYGKDYELMGEDIVVTPQDKTLLERTMTEDFSDENTEYVVDVPDSVLESLDEDEPSLEVQMTPGKSSLAALKESQSGIEARTTVLKEGNPLDGSAVSMTVLQSIVPQLMDSMGSSSEVTVSFAPGEDLKYLSLRIFDDSKSEGNESLNLSFSEAEGVEIGTANSVSITVEDNEPKEYSYFSFDSMVYYAENGSVDVVIQRTGAPYSMADMKLTTSGTTADCSEEVIFAPYEMKKTVSIDVNGDGQFSVALEEPKAAKLGSPSSAKVYMNKTEQLSRKSAARNSLSSESKEIYIDTNLKVVFEGSKNYGKVYDTTFTPQLEVGTFYRPGPKDAYDYSNPNQEILEEQYPVYWNYDKDDNLSGDKPWGCGYYDCYYKKDSDEGVLKYYHTSCWAEGSEKTEMSGIINPLYYQYFQPYWVQTQDHNNKYNESVFEMYTSNDNKLIKSSVVKGQFSKKLGTDATIRVDAGDSRYPIRNPVAFRILARDTYGGACAKINLYYGGLFCKYRQIRVRTELPSTLEYIDYQADGSKSKHYSVPANVNARCGAQVVTDTEARDVYVNTDSTKSQMVFSLGMVSLYNQANIYGQIKGYSIKHKAYNSATSGATVTTYYPDDYRKEIDDSFGSVDNVISYSYMDRENLFAQIREDLGQISFDKYFVDFLDRREVMRTTSSDGKGFLYELTFKPDFEYIPVKVKILPPYSDTEDSKCTGSFTNPMLSKYSQLTLHAGDRLDLSATADYPEYYRVTGYQISTDGGIKFDDIRSDVKLLLEPHKDYVIRPLLERQDNYIELRLSDKAKEVLDLRNAITSDIDGAIRTVLNLNPSETTAEKQARPDVGEVYQIAAVQKRHIAPAGMEYRPVIKDVMTGEVYDTGLLYVTARDAKKNNLYEIDVELVNLSELSTFNITGNLQMEVDTIRSNGLEQAHVPLVNYSVTAGSVPENADSSSSLVVTGFTDENGDYKVENVRGKMGDKISILVSDGLRDNQIISVTLNGAADSGNTLVNAGSEILHYPASSPKVTSIEYRYAKELNNQKQGF